MKTTIDYRSEGKSPEESKTSAGLGLLSSLRVSIIATILLAIIVSGVYPLLVWCFSQMLFYNKANGSLIGKDGNPVSDPSKAVGSALIGQNFSDGKYFHGRPSAAGNGYDPTASSGSNLGPTSAKLLLGTTKNSAFTIFAADKGKTAVVPVAARIQATVAAVTKTSIRVTAAPATTKATYNLDPAVADPNAVVAYHGRTIHATTIPVGAIVELKFNDKTPPAVTAINVADQELDGAAATIDTSANKITLNDSGSTVVNFDPKNTVFVVNGKADAKPTDLTTDMSLHMVVATVMDNDGIADRVIHYCQDNKIDYKSSVPDSTFTDADGVDDVKLITAFNGAATPTIAPKTALPADAVTASGSGLDPHISPENAKLQAQRVADARNVKVDKVNALIEQYTDGASLGFLGEAGVNVLRLNLALDQQLPAPAPAATPTTAPSTAPTAAP